ncbi:hypothetical protein HTIA_1291 [Halorhabdus tiamatea SARL4B]|uniref:Uncharacterized protein n=1 Tax=Halorhabdus tiamatea SARL4B TaxID=1033806 RepID=S6D2M7_9EURY|nr:hypothetical protein HTIA_1291 [Halorhabdus tiamatea SARL4B]
MSGRMPPYSMKRGGGEPTTENRSRFFHQYGRCDHQRFTRSLP